VLQSLDPEQERFGMDATHRNDILKTALTDGMKKGWSGFSWILKIIIPVSFLTALLAWSGMLDALDFLIRPVMSMLHLPAIAALPLMIGVLTGIYGGIASMAVLPITLDEMTLIAIFILIAHNLIQEGIIQARSGMHPLKATLFRLTVAVITVILVAPFLDTESVARPIAGGTADLGTQPFLEMMMAWGSRTIDLVIRIFFIIMFIMGMLEVLKAFDWIDPIVRRGTPLLKAMGLSPRVGMLWMTAVIFGLTYGGAVIVEETKHESLSRNELEALHLSIGINHSMIEDAALFLPLGIGPFWLWVPRLLVAILAVRLLALWQMLRRRIGV